MGTYSSVDHNTPDKSAPQFTISFHGTIQVDCLPLLHCTLPLSLGNVA